MREAANFVPMISPTRSESILLSKDMPSEWSISPNLIFKDPRVPSLSEIIVIASSGESERYVPQNYVFESESKAYVPFDYISEQQFEGYFPLSYVSKSESKGILPLTI